MDTPKAEVWLYQDNGSSLCGLLENLPEPQRKRASELHSKRQREYVIGRTMLARALRQKSDSERWLIRERPGLSPIIEHSTSNFISNISHSRGWVGLAVREIHGMPNALLGLDIEVVKLHRRLDAASHFCNSAQLNELNTIKTSDDRSRYYSQLWTQKEAYFKAHQQTIWNTRIKSISFAHNQLEEIGHSNVVQSTDYKQSLKISLCTESPCKIDTWLIQELNQSTSLQLDHLELAWQPFGVKDE